MRYRIGLTRQIRPPDGSSHLPLTSDAMCPLESEGMLGCTCRSTGSGISGTSYVSACFPKRLSRLRFMAADTWEWLDDYVDKSAAFLWRRHRLPTSNQCRYRPCDLHARPGWPGG